MKKFTPYLIPIVCSLCLFSNAQQAAVDKEAPRVLPGWGTATDPDQDCRFSVVEEGLVISVPGSRPHDLAADINTVNAPRVLQAVDGDFSIQVKVEGLFAPGEESTKPGRTGYNGAAIVALVDEQNVVTLARAVLQHPGHNAMPYANFEMRVDGKLQRIGLTNDHPLPIEGPVYLRLERRGTQFLAAVSIDGVKWDSLEPKEIPATWPKEL